MSRLTLLHINIIGAVVAIIVGVALYFTIITSAQDEVKKSEDVYKQVKARADKWDENDGTLKKALAAKAQAETAYARYQDQYMPTLGYTADRLTTMQKVFWPNNGRSWPERFIRTINSHMAREQKQNGIVWENKGVVALGPYGPDPNAIDAGQTGEGLGPVLHYRYPMAVRARSLAGLLNHLRDWPSVRGIGVPVIENWQMTGNSPELRATYDLTLTIITHEEPPPLNPRIGGQQTAGGGAAGGGMYSGMMGGRGMSGPARGGMMGAGAPTTMTAPPMGGMGNPGMMGGAGGPTAGVAR